MRAAAADLEFEEAARLRDEIRRLEGVELGLDRPGMAPDAASRAGLGPKKAGIQDRTAHKRPRQKKKIRRGVIGARQ
jgi:excinuclease ABC subunit B